MSYLDVPGAMLYYEQVGSGPLLLCISGADGSADIWKGFAQCLKDKFTVVAYDRRGFSRSHLVGAQDYAHRLETDADDAALLIKHISPNEPATVIGNSSGAIISLKLLVRHPDILKTLAPYEPPAARFLDDFDELWAFHEETYKLYRESGPAPAFVNFAKLTKADQSKIAKFMAPKPNGPPFLWSNIQYWFEREFMTYPQAEFDIDGELRPLKDKLLLILGEDSPRDAYQFRANVALAEKLGIETVLFPGEHVSHATHALPFSQKFLEVLKERDQAYADL